MSPTHTFEEILEECSLKLELNAKALYTAQGALVDNVVFIRCELQFFICSYLLYDSNNKHFLVKPIYILEF